MPQVELNVSCYKYSVESKMSSISFTTPRCPGMGVQMLRQYSMLKILDIAFSYGAMLCP